MRRAFDPGAIFASVLGAVDLELVATTTVNGALHGSADFKTNVLPMKAAAGIIGSTPGVLAWLRAVPVVTESAGSSLPAFAATDVV